MILIDMFKTILLGMAIAAPVGPISLLCIRTTLASGFVAGFSAGLGAALADGLVSLGALAGVEIISTSPLLSGPILNYCAAAFLIYVGSKLVWQAGTVPQDENADKAGVGKSFVSTFFVTIINPLTLLSFAALFCGSRNTDHSMITVLITAACIFLGSAIWWLILACFLSIARSKLGRKAMKAINIGSAFCILACGLKLIFV